MNRTEITAAKEEMLKAMANDLPKDRSFAGLAFRAEGNLIKSIGEARLVVEAAARASGGFAKLTNEGGEEVPALSDALFLIEGMRRVKDMIFREVDRIEIGMSGGRVNKVSKRLYCATEGYIAARSVIGAVGHALEEKFPGFKDETYESAAKTVAAISEWDQGSFGAIENASYAQNILRAIEDKGEVSLALFVCPPVQFSYLKSDEPERYFQTSLSGSLLSRQVDDLRRLFSNLKCASIPVRLTVIVGDADEDDYIWPVLGKPSELLDERLIPRRETLCSNIIRYLSESVGKKDSTNVRVLSAQEIEIVSLATFDMPQEIREIYRRFVAMPEEMQQFLRSQDFADERSRLLELWNAGDYYDGLPLPDDNALEQVVIRKFAAYAMQGVLLGELAPNTVLIQTERPPLLRTRMLNSGRTCLGMAEIPAAYQCISQEDWAQEEYGGLAHG